MEKITTKDFVLLAPFLSFEKTLEALDCSRSFLYSLIEEKIISPKYIKRKPYFLIDDILKAMTEKQTA